MELSTEDLGPLTVDLKLANVGEIDSDEVIQACVLFLASLLARGPTDGHVVFSCRYMMPPRRSGIPTPSRQLLDFERVHVAKGKVASLSFSIITTQLQLVRRTVAAGTSLHHCNREGHCCILINSLSAPVKFRRLSLTVLGVAVSGGVGWDAGFSQR